MWKNAVWLCQMPPYFLKKGWSFLHNHIVTSQNRLARGSIKNEGRERRTSKKAWRRKLISKKLVAIVKWKLHPKRQISSRLHQWFVVSALRIWIKSKSGLVGVNLKDFRGWTLTETI